MSAADTTHECPAPGCLTRVPFARFACPAHWFSIPQVVRNRLNREYRESFGERTYFEARAECLAALGVADVEIAAANGGVGRRDAA